MAELSAASEAEDFIMLDISHEYLKIDENPELDEDAKSQRKLASRKKMLNEKSARTTCVSFCALIC